MADNTSKNKRMARNTIFLYIRMAFVMLVTLYTSRVILQTLGVVDFGVYNVVAGFVSMFTFLNTSLTACIQRYYNYENGLSGSDGFRKVFVTSFYIQLVLSLIILLSIETIGLWYLNNKLVIPPDRLTAANLLFQFSIFSMVLVIMQVPYSAAVMAKEKMDYYALVGIVDILLKLGIVVILTYVPLDKLSLYGGLLFAVLTIDFLLYFLYAKIKFVEIKLSLSFDRNLFKSMLSFSGWSMLGSFAQIVRSQGINILINLFFGPTINAACGLSYQVRTALSSFMANIPTAARPQLIEAYAKGEYDRSKHIMFSISKICFYLIYIVALPVAYEMNYLLHLWLGDTIPEYTVIFSQIILVIAIVEAYNWPVSMIIYASGRIGWYNIFTSVIGLLILPICYLVLVIDPNPVLVYIISLLISVSVQIASLMCMQKTVNVSVLDYSKNVLLPSLIVCTFSALIPLPLILFFEEGFARTVLVFAISISLTCMLSYKFGLNVSEKKLVNNYMSKITRRKNVR